MRKPDIHRPAWISILFGAIAMIVLLLILYNLPPIHDRLAWRFDFTWTYLTSRVDPAGPLPTTAALAKALLSPTPSPTLSDTSTPTPEPTPTPQNSPTPTTSPTPLPERVVLAPPLFEKQAPNNCGAATLAMYLRYYGWKGTQVLISDATKPITADRNVNVEELVAYARTHAGWLNTEYRVGGDRDLLRSLLAEGIPVMIEESSRVEEKFARYDDDYWDGHYLLITGYDDSIQTFITQDSFLGANRKVTYQELEQNWQPFNHVYILIFLPSQTTTIQSLLGSQWDATMNRQKALDASQLATQQDAQNAFDWFNYGSNLVYFEQYQEAAQAYDQARKIGLPQRILRYQFGPFMAYFHAGRIDDLLVLTQYALKITDNSEEALLWQGWGFYRQGKKVEAIESFNRALKHHPGYEDALYALKYVQEN
jgi:tetratricopeptide (TPR) repeat protein